LRSGGSDPAPETTAFGPGAAEAAPARAEPLAASLDAPLGSPSAEALAQETIAAQPEPEPAAVEGSQVRAVARPLPSAPRSLEQAAAQGDAVALYDLALQRIAADETSEGVALLRRAAGQDLAMAQYRLAKLYERGEAGVPQDIRQARQWTERAANNGNRRAMHDLGVFYARGEGAPLDEQAAFRWFRQAADLGVTDSQYNLGVLYQQGRGVSADPAEALFWYLVAARNGDRDAQSRAAAVEQMLTQTQIEQTRARAQAFRPRAASARANGEFGARAWAARAS
ncbi:MAG: sel1 repeat family protein, partial [Hydrogenophilaceae bacterium]|nr:sel1 repeat family protein [Hydrogenophilaceae bacterium]